MPFDPMRVREALVTADTVQLRGTHYFYWILEQGFGPVQLPHFVAMYTKSPLHFLISKAVPEEYREYFILHEVFCLVEYEGQPGRCLQALKKELEYVKPEHLDGYLRFRLNFFEAMVSYYQTSPSEEFKAEISACRDYLGQLVSGQTANS